MNHGLPKNGLTEQLYSAVTNISPYEVPKRIWGLIEKYFEANYKIQVAKVRPTARVETATICWRTQHRRPGAGKEGILNARGPSFSHTRGTDPTGLVHEVQTQHHTVIYEFSVFGTSNDEADRIAWDLECALLQVTGLIQEIVPGFNWSFDQQLGDTDLSWKGQDDLMVRTIRWEAVVPVRYLDLIPELKRVEMVVSVNSTQKRAVKFTRTSTDTTRFDIPVNSGEKVLRINRIILGEGRQAKLLSQDTDWVETLDPTTRLLYVEWKDEYGLTPTMGQTFLVDFEITQHTEPLDITG